MRAVNPLRLRRISKAMTQSELASRAGISQQLLSKLEGGIIQLKVDKAIELAEILGCRPAEIMPALALSPQPDTENAREIELLTLWRALDDRDKDTVFHLAGILAHGPRPRLKAG